MEIRPVQPADLPDLAEIDGTIDSAQYLHLDRSGDALALSWKLDERPLRQRRIHANRLDDEAGRHLLLKHVVTGIEDGLALLAEHEGRVVALALAQPQPDHGTLRVEDLRVDFDHRRQGVATALLYQVIAAAREQGLRAVVVETRTDNVPAAHLLGRCGFELSGLDDKRYSNHDLVKEAVALYWYTALD